MEKFRWENEDNHISIERAISTDYNQPVFIVKSNIAFENLPVSFRNQVPESNTTATNEFIKNIKKYAEENGYTSIDLENET